MNRTALDLAHADIGTEDGARRFYRALADAELILLLEAEAEDGQIRPRVFVLEDGPVILAFDSEERLATLGEGPLPYAALPGRVIAAQMAGQGLSLGLNLGTGADSEIILPPEALDWLIAMLDQAPPEQVEGRPAGFHAPDLPALAAEAIATALAAMTGLAEAGLLAGVRYDGGRRGHLLALIGTAVGAEAALARAVTEALAFSGLDAAALDVVFLTPEDPALGPLARVARAFEVPRPVAPSAPVAPRAPGSDPDKPPILR